MKKTEIDLGVFIASCDRYSDLWEPFFYFFRKYWSDCPFPVYLMSNTNRHCLGIPIQVQGSCWSEEMRNALLLFPHQYLLYFQDDYFLNRKVNNQDLERILDVLCEYRPAYFRLFPHRGPKEGVLLDDDIQYLNKDELFSCSLQVAIWEKKSLLELLNKVENIWQFELNAGQRAIKLSAPFLSVVWQKYLSREDRRYPINYFCTAVRKGKWRKDALEFCKKEGYSTACITRSIENSWDILKKRIYDLLPIPVQILITKYSF